MSDNAAPAVGAPSQPNTRDASPAAIIPQKRAANDDTVQDSATSQLEAEMARRTEAPAVKDRTARAKKESFKKREAKGGAAEARATPDLKTSPKKPKGGQNEDTDAAISPMRYTLPPPKITDFEKPQDTTFVPHHVVKKLDGEEVEFFETDEHVFNKKSFRYTHCIADPAFPSSQMYRQTESAPYGPRFSFEDQSTHMYMDKTGKMVTTDKGFRMTKANVCVREGRFYYECKITSGIPKKGQTSEGHVRMGWARREATLETPCGFDAYSYGIRDVAGQKVHLSRPQDFFPKGENIEVGDVIGFEINLPSERLHKKVVEGSYNPAVDLVQEDEPENVAVSDIIRDRIPIRFKGNLYFEQVDYHPIKELEDLMNPVPVITSSGHIVAHETPSPTHPVPALRTLPGSSIKVYKNGVYMGEPFKDLLGFLPPASKPQVSVGAREGLDDGALGYYPAISVFRGGAAEINLGPDFWFPIGGAEDDDEVDMVGSDQPVKKKVDAPRPVSDRYAEQIADDVVWDIIDECDHWAKDGFTVKKNWQGRSVPVEGEAEGGIKELVQDEE